MPPPPLPPDSVGTKTTKGVWFSISVNHIIAWKGPGCNNMPELDGWGKYALCVFSLWVSCDLAGGIYQKFKLVYF